MDNSSWRSSFAHDSRQQVVKKIMETLKRHMPRSGLEGVDELLKIAWRFEEKIFLAATDQKDYFDKISGKMQSLEAKANGNSHQRPASGLPGRGSGAPGVPGIPGSGASQMRNVAGLGNVIQLGTQNQQHLQQQQQQQLQQLQQHQLLTQSLQANGASGSQTTVAGLTSNLPGTASVGQNPMAGMDGQGMNSTIMSNRLQQMQQQRQAVQHQQVSQQQSGQQQQLLYQQQQHQRMQQHQAAMMKQKLQMQQQQQQQQQQSLMQHHQHQSLQHQQQKPVNQFLIQNNAALQQQQLLQQQLLQSKQQPVQQPVQQQHQQQQTTTSTLLQQPQQLQPTVQHPGQQGQLGQQRHGSNQQSQQRIGNSGGLHHQHQLQQQQQQANMSLQAQQPQVNVPFQPQQQQPNMPLPAQQHRAIPEHPTVVASVELSAQSGPTGSGGGNIDQRELVWKKLQFLKDKYLQDMTELFRMLSARSNQPMLTEQLQKLKHYKDVLHKMIPYLQVPKDRVPKAFNQDKVDAFEKQIVSIMETFKRMRQPQPATPGGPAPPVPPPAPQVVAQPVPVQHLDQVNVSQAPQPQPQSPQMSHNSQPVLQIPNSSQGIQSVQQQQQQQQQLLPQMQQEKQIQRQQLTGVGPQATGSMILPCNNAQPSLQHNPGALQQTLVGTPLQSAVAPTSHPLGAAMPTNSTGLIGQNGLAILSENFNVPNNFTQPSMDLPQPEVVSSHFGVNTYQQSPNNTLQQNGGCVTSLPSQNNAIQQQIEQLQAQQQRPVQQKDMQQRQLQQQQQRQQNHQNNQAVQLQAFRVQPQMLDPYTELKLDASLKVTQAAANQALHQAQNLNQRQMNQQQLQQQQLPHNIGSPQLVPSSQISQVVSPQSDQAFRATQMNKTGTPPQTFRITSPSTLSATPPTQDEVDHDGSTHATKSTIPCNMLALQAAVRSTGPIYTPGMSVSPLMENTSSPSPGQALRVHDAVPTFSPGTPFVDRTISTDPPLEQLKKRVDSMPKEILMEAVDELNDVVSCGDKLGGSAPGTGSRAAIGEDLSAKTRSMIQAQAILKETRNPSMKRRRVNSDPVILISADGTISNARHRSRHNTDVGNRMVSHIDSPLLKITASLEEEIRHINSRLIDTIVEVSTEVTEKNAAQGQNGIVLSCCYKGNALNPNVSFLQAKEYALFSRTSLYLTVLPTYPECSPHIWFDDSNPHANHHCFRGAREEFKRSLRCKAPPLSLAFIATIWDECARKSLTEYAHQQGGGNFITAFGAWETAHQIACKSVS